MKRAKALFQERELLPNSMDLDKAYELFSANYEKATGVAWTREKFISRAHDWVFYGEEGRGYVAVRPQRSGLQKLVGVGGSPLAVAKGMKELLSLKKPVWGMASKELVQAMHKLGMKSPPAWVVKRMIAAIPGYVFGNVRYTINKDGSITLDYEDVGQATKYFIANKEYYSWLLKMAAEKLPKPIRVVVEYMAKGIEITKNVIAKIKSLFTEEELRESEYYVNDDGMAFDDEGNSWKTGSRSGIYGLRNRPSGGGIKLSQRDLNSGKIYLVVKELPDHFKLADVSKAANKLDIPHLTYKQKFGIIIGQAQKWNKKLLDGKK